MKTVIEMAKEAGFMVVHEGDSEIGAWYECFTSEIERFAELVRADERDACAKVCEDIYNDPKGNNGDDYYYTRPYLECADAIRARSNT